jgi:hypothetical protein
MKTVLNHSSFDRKQLIISHNVKFEIIGFVVCIGIIFLELVLFVRAIR